MDWQKWVALILGCIFALKAILLFRTTGGPGAAFVAGSMIVFWGLLAGICWAPLIGEYCGYRWGWGFYWSRGYLKVPVAKLCAAKALIVSAKFEEAAETLKKLFEQYPNDSEIVITLAELYLDKMNDPGNALGLLLVYFDEKRKRRPGDAELALRVADLYLKLKLPKEAQAFLEKESVRKDHCHADRELLSARLASLAS